MRVAASIALTDTGRKRRRNEDAFLCEPPLFAVADGMGGAQAGEVASQLAAGTLREQGSDSDSPAERVTALIREANRRVFAYSSEHTATRGMGTTITVALVEDEAVTIGHVGDSRAYLIRDGRLTQLTQDHSLVAELVRSGRISPEEAETHPQRSVITRALGTDEEVEIDVFSVRPNDHDLFLLCSDGLTTMLDDDSIENEFQNRGDSLDAIASSLIEAANRAGGEDNITVVLFSIDGVAEEMSEEGGGAFAEEKTLTELEGVPPLSEETTAAKKRAPSRHRGTFVLIGSLDAVSVLIAAGTWILSWAHFVGAEPDGHVAIYQGLPYELPAGIHLYRPVHVSGQLFAAQLGQAERQKLFNHDLRSYGSANRELESLEEAVNP